MNSWLFLSLILAHVIGDFYLQNDKYCAQKEERKFVGGDAKCIVLPD